MSANAPAATRIPRPIRHARIITPSEPNTMIMSAACHSGASSVDPSAAKKACAPMITEPMPPARAMMRSTRARVNEPIPVVACGECGICAQAVSSTPEQFAKLPVVPSRTASTAQGSAAIGGSASGAGAAQGATRDVTAATSGQAYITRLGDIARIEEAPDEHRRRFRSNGKDQVGIAITRQSQANDLEISEGVRAALKDINPSLPKGTRLEVGAEGEDEEAAVAALAELVEGGFGEDA